MNVAITLHISLVINQCQCSMRFSGVSNCLSKGIWQSTMQAVLVMLLDLMMPFIVSTIKKVRRKQHFTKKHIRPQKELSINS